MSDADGASDLGSVADNGVPAVVSTADVEAIVADFRHWITESTLPRTEPVLESSPVDFPQLLAQFTALRHEVNLQTKASRGANDQIAEALKLLANPPVPKNPDDAIRPAVKTLIDLADALQTARKQLERSEHHLQTLVDELSELHEASWPEPPCTEPAGPAPAQGFWARLFGRAPTPAQAVNDWQQWAETVTDLQQDQALLYKRIANRWQELLQGISDGYVMSLRRVERALPTLDLQPINSLGQPFDPERMEAVELVDGEPSGVVMEEVRPGYFWKGQLFRYAQVKVAR